MHISEKDSIALKILKFFLILGVVLIHCNFLKNVNPNDINTSGSFFIQFICINVCAICVPCFFILSGYLYFHNFSNLKFDIYIKKTKSRIHTLIIPYLIWNLIGLIIQIVKCSFLGYPSYGIIEDGKIDFYRLICGFWDMVDGYPYAFAFWFIRNLIIFVILSPIAYLIGKHKVVFIIFISLLFFLDESIYYFLFFVLGAFISYNWDIALKRITLSRFTISSIIWIGLSIVSTMVPFTKGYIFILTIKSLSAFIALLFVTKLLINVYNNHLLFKMFVLATFFIYSIHQFFCTVIRNFYITIFGIESLHGVILTFGSSFVTLTLLSFMTWYILKRISPQTVSVLSGNR